MTPNPDNDYVEVYEDKAGEYRWRRKDPNGNIVSESGEGYTSDGYAASAARAYNVNCEVRLV